MTKTLQFPLRGVHKQRAELHAKLQREVDEAVRIDSTRITDQYIDDFIDKNSDLIEEMFNEMEIIDRIEQQQGIRPINEDDL